MTMAQQAIGKLNAITNEQYCDTNWWDEVVAKLGGFDWDATDEADSESDIVVFGDGSRCMMSGGEWVAE